MYFIRENAGNRVQLENKKIELREKATEQKVIIGNCNLEMGE